MKVNNSEAHFVEQLSTQNLPHKHIRCFFYINNILTIAKILLYLYIFSNIQFLTLNGISIIVIITTVIVSPVICSMQINDTTHRVLI